MIYTFAILSIFPALMIYAALMDMFTMTIPNKISLALIGAFVLLVPFSGLTLGQIGVHVLVATIALGIGIGLFSLGWVGGGDVKFFASICLWFGSAQLMEFTFMSAILGGVLTVILMGFRQIALPAGWQSREWIGRLHGENNGVPYGIAIAGGALLVFPDTIWVTGLAAGL